MFNVIVAYLRNNGSFDSQFVKAFEASYGVTEKELRDWVDAETNAALDEK